MEQTNGDSTNHPSAPEADLATCLQPLAPQDLVNMEPLRRLVEGWGAAGAEVAADLIRAFLGVSQSDLKAIEQALLSGDCEQLREAAHRWKGSAGQVGASRVALLCGAIEKCAKGRTLCTGGLCLEELQAAYQQTCERLQAELVSLFGMLEQASSLEAPSDQAGQEPQLRQSSTKSRADRSARYESAQ